MKNWLILGGGTLLVLAGVVWTLQGLSILPGSAMSGVTLWAIVGPIVAGIGLALVVWGFARQRRTPRA